MNKSRFIELTSLLSDLLPGDLGLRALLRVFLLLQVPRLLAPHLGALVASKSCSLEISSLHRFY